MESGIVRSSLFGRKRVILSNTVDIGFISTTPTKRFCCPVSALETLPKDILLKIACGVDHDDLKRLFHVSRIIREVTLIAKRCHFEFSTPKKTVGFQNADEVKAPNAPRQLRIARNRKKLGVALFSSDGEENWPRRELFIRIDTEV